LSGVLIQSDRLVTQFFSGIIQRWPDVGIPARKVFTVIETHPSLLLMERPDKREHKEAGRYQQEDVFEWCVDVFEWMVHNGFLTGAKFLCVQYKLIPSGIRAGTGKPSP
jgi:hypothetical protein